jgi:hypothetical protein
VVDSTDPEGVSAGIQSASSVWAMLSALEFRETVEDFILILSGLGVIRHCRQSLTAVFDDVPQ